MIQNTENSGSTQPNKTIQKSKRGRAFLFNALGLIVILGLAVVSGYQSGIATRENTRSTVMLGQLGEQFQNALVDMQFGRYENAKQRLEWIITNDPTFPGAQEKLTEVLVLMNVPTPTVTPSLTPTPDFSGAEQAFTRAQQLVAAQDWPAAIGALDQVRKLDPNYQQSQVDGMYYFALRNYGYNLITQQGNLEGGIYQLTLAERFGQLDRDTNGLREGARYYILGASFWELNWEQALFYFSQVYGGWSSLWDGSMTAAERFRVASMRYGDQLFAKEQFCDAVTQYDNAQKVGPLDKLSVSPTIEGGGGTTTDTPPPPVDTPTETPPTP
jgi:tetratricopeptide (TPR) repeat protein